MGNVVSLTKRDPQIWVCNCGCSTFRLFETGITECAACGVQGCDGGDWRAELPEPPAEAIPIKSGQSEDSVVSFNDAAPQAALRTMINRINIDNLTALIAIENSSRVRTWGGVETGDQREWLDRRLDDARDLLTLCVAKGGD